MLKFSSFFVTEKGRKIIFAGAATFGLSLFAGNFLPHSLFLNKYKEIVACYKEGIEVPVPEKVKEYVEVACEKLAVHPYYRKFIKPFTVFGFNIFEVGSTKYRSGCALGIPVNFSYETEQDIDRNLLRVRNNKIIWDSDDGKLLQKSLILTENEKIFAISKAILQLETHRVLMNSIFPSFSFLSMYAFGSRLNQKLNLYTKPLSLRIIMYTILALFGFGIWMFLKDFNQVSYDIYIDNKLAEISPEFIMAGISYYDKLLARNVAFRNLIGNDDYTAKGNENFFLRQKSLPITYRKAFFEMKLEELKKSLNETKQITS